MKKQTRINLWLLVIAVLIAVKANAQFQITPATFGEFGGNTAPIRGIGIGNFPSGIITNSALHINTNYMTASTNYPGINFGEVFRTDCPNLATYWRMLRGGNEYGLLYNNNDNHFYMQATNIDGSIIFNTYQSERMRIYDENFLTPIAGISNPGMVRIGKSGGTDPNGFGPILKKPKLLVAGSEQNLISAEGNYVVAEFRSQFETSSSASIKIRGSRYSKTHLCTAQIDFANYDYDESPAVEFNLARLCADMMDEHDQKSFFHINTRDDKDNFNSKFLIDNIGLTGVGTVFKMNIFDVFNGPQRRLHVYDNADAPQFRISQTYNIDPALGVWTDFKTDVSGTLTIIPTGDKVGIGFSATAPQQTLDVFGTERIRSMSVNNLQTEIVVRDPANGDLYLNTSIANNASNAWNIFGNAGTNSVTNYLGTSDAVDLVLRTKNIERLRIIGSTIGSVLEGNIGIGYNSPTAKLHSQYDYTPVITPDINGEFVIRGVYNSNTPKTIISVQGNSLSTNQGAGIATNIGGDFSAISGNINFGVRGIVYSNLPPNMGPAVFAGVYGDANPTLPGNNRAWAGYFNGSLFTTGAYYPSDEKLKTDIKDYSGGLDVIKKLYPKSYSFNTKNDLGLNLPQETQYGFLTSNVKEVLDGLVTNVIQPRFDSVGKVISIDSFEAMNYIELIAILTSSVRDLSDKVDAQQAQLDGCCNNQMKIADTNSPAQHINLTAPVKIQLGNCIPNPNNGETNIPFHVPDNIVKAEIVFTDLLGNEFNSVEITSRGYSYLSVSTSELEDGVYNYSLFVDGQLIDTKQMIKQH